MRKLAAVFAVAVLGPSLVLGWLATRSLRDQEVIVHSQRALLHQAATEALAGELNLFLGDVRVFYGRLLEELIAERGAEALAADFHATIRSRWSQAAVGAAVTEDGRWLNAPAAAADPRLARFFRETQPFLENEDSSDFYLAPAISGKVVAVREVESPGAGSGASPDSGPGRSGVGAAVQGTTPAPPVPAAAPFAAAAATPAAPEPVAGASTAGTSPPTDSLAAQAGGPIQAGPLAKAPAQTDAPSRKVGDPLPPLPPPPGAESRAFTQQKVTVETPAPAPAGGMPQSGLAFSPHQSLPPGAPASAATASAEAPSAGPGETPPHETARSRNVKPLGQLDRLQGDGQVARLTEAASEALATNVNRREWSQLFVNSGQLHDLVRDNPEGAVSRFVSGGLQILLWRRDPAAPGLIFWVQLDIDELKQELSQIIRQSGSRRGRSEACLALLDAGGQVVAQTLDGFTTDWGRPFVASEVGEMLPHWEVAAYLIDPLALARTARSARITLWMLVPVLLTAIGVGSVLIIRDIGREVAFARQKTDFVSNVSHELKTPLTSIRLFSDLLSQRSGMPEDKRLEYSGIIAREAARLSRLINQLLDFSRMERGEKRYRRERFDARDLVRETVETCRHQIESEGYTLTLDDGCGEEPAPLLGDRDALSQVLLNLLSNAEKYGGTARRIEVETRRDRGVVEIDVLDRGPGIPRRHAARIFEKFYRADDSLSSGIEGSGLGLTLARQIARAHRGEVDYSPRPDGGSRFTLRLPIAAPDPAPLPAAPDAPASPP